jgi:hypothetical protein
LNSSWSAEYTAVVEAVIAASITGTKMTALRINKSKIFRFAKPVAPDETSFVATSTANSTIVVPPATADETLTHKI